MKRVGRVAKLLSRNGVVAVFAALSPYREPRDLLRREARRFVEVFVDCQMETLLTRDPIYKKAMAGEVKNVPGVDDPYEPPTHAEVTVQSNQESVEAAAARVFQALVNLKYMGPTEFEQVLDLSPCAEVDPRQRAAPAPHVPAHEVGDVGDRGIVVDWQWERAQREAGVGALSGPCHVRDRGREIRERERERTRGGCLRRHLQRQRRRRGHRSGHE